MKRIFILLALGIVAVGTYYGYQFYTKMFVVNTPLKIENDILLIPTGSTLADVVDSLKGHGQIMNEKTFLWTADKMHYDDQNIKAGRYVIKTPMNNKNIVSLLRGARQTPLQLTIHNVRTIEQMAGRVASRLEFDSTELMQYIEQHFDSLAGTTPPTRLTRFIPNTYEFYWTVSPEEFSKRMLKEYENFWTDEKKAKSEKVGLSPEEVYTLASIIEKETNYNPEKPKMAGVYLNRIRTGIPLQADPTIVFALGDFEIKRVLYGHLEIDSPYNTYKNLGLPPGPIFMPGTSSINAVLDKEDHDLLYFCARPTEEGPGHAFASTLTAHNQNAERYQRWLDTQGIY